MTAYTWISPRGFANEGTLYSYNPENAAEMAAMDKLRAFYIDDADAVVTDSPRGVDYRDATRVANV